MTLLLTFLLMMIHHKIWSAAGYYRTTNYRSLAEANLLTREEKEDNRTIYANNETMPWENKVEYISELSAI